MAAVSSVLFFSALLNFYAFSGDYGILSDLLVYEREDVFETGGGDIFIEYTCSFDRCVAAGICHA